jgi:hypothetical protein
MAQSVSGADVYQRFKSTLLDAINKAEGGWSAAVPYGIQGTVTRQGVTYFPSRAAASALVDNIYESWIQRGKPGDFLSYLQSVWAPIGATNDPQNLNRNWLGNVTAYLRQHGLSIGGGAPQAAPAPQAQPGPAPSPAPALGTQAVKTIVYVAGGVLLLYGIYGLVTHRGAQVAKVIS